MNTEAIDKLKSRVGQLKSEQAQLTHEIMQAQANLNAYNGAIQELERTIALLEETEASKKLPE